MGGAAPTAAGPLPDEEAETPASTQVHVRRRDDGAGNTGGGHQERRHRKVVPTAGFRWWWIVGQARQVMEQTVEIAPGDCRQGPVEPYLDSA